MISRRSVTTAAIAAAALVLAMTGTSCAAPPAAPEQVATGLQFPEGTIFVGDTLYFVDYQASSVLRLRHGTVSTVWHQDGCGANGLVDMPEGLWVACFSGQTIELISLDGKLLQTIDRDEAGHQFQGPNDLTADGKGGAWFTGSGSGAIPGKVYHMTASHRVRQVADGIRFANGVATSPDGKLLYIAESPTGRIWRFTVNSDGTIGGRTEFLDLGAVLPGPGRPSYTPDSIRTDRDGNLLVALYDGGGFAMFRPDGTLLAKIDVPLKHHTNLAVSPDGRFVYVTAVDDVPGNGYRGELYRVINPASDDHARP